MHTPRTTITRSKRRRRVAKPVLEPRFELLEPRILFDVTAAIDGNGVVTITGDANANSITIRGDSNGVITIKGTTGGPQTFGGQGVPVTKIVVNGGDGDDNIQLNNKPAKLPKDANGDPIEAEINGQGGDDTVEGGGGADSLNGGEGNDKVRGNGGNDQLNGENGNDDLGGGAGDDVNDGGDGNDDIKDKEGNNTVRGGAGDDNIRTGSGNDDIDAGSGNNTVIDDGGNNNTSAAEGNDTLKSKGAGTNNVSLGDGDNQASFKGGTVSYTGGSGIDQVMVKNSALTAMLGGGADWGMGTLFGTSNIDGQDGNDTLNFSSPRGRAFQPAGSVTLTGGNGMNNLWYRRGKNRSEIMSLTVNGGPNDDVINVMDGTFFPIGNLTINTGGGMNTGVVKATRNLMFNGGSGVDHFSLFLFVLDSFVGAAAFDILLFGGDDEVEMLFNFVAGILFTLNIDGGDGNDFISGKRKGGSDGESSIAYNGGMGNDHIHGSKFSEVINGGDGDDSADGGGGNDTFQSVEHTA